MFMEYASHDEDKDHLSKSEAKQLLEKEFPHFASVSFLPLTFVLDVQRQLQAVKPDGSFVVSRDCGLGRRVPNAGDSF